ncbi:MAG: LamG domain-containing protein, partial [Gemmatimonadota bacterium]|nr:LamG domain-containing protein [Gemmatimonadota bacterium]
AKKARTGEYFAFQDGRTLPIKFRIENGALCDPGALSCTEFTVRSDGGDFTLLDPETGRPIAGLSVPLGAIGEGDEVTVVIEEQDPPHQGECLPTGLAQSEGCYQFRTEPELYPFGELVRLEACVLPTGLTVEQEDLLLLHKYNATQGLVALPWADPQLIDCTDFTPFAAAESQSGPVRYASLAWQQLRQAFTTAFAPRQLEAAVLGTVPKGLGGLGGSFSDVGGAVPDVPPGVVSWWRANDDALDLYYNRNDGTLFNGTTFAPGIFGSAFSFDGLDDYVEAPSVGLDVLPTFSLEAWVELDQLSGEDEVGTYQRFVTLEWERAVIRYDGENGPRQLHFYARIDEGLRHIRVNNVLQTGCFHHVVGTYDGNVMRAYLDGVLVGTNAVTGALDSEEAGAVTFSHPFDGPMDGLLDEIRIFDRALTGEEIQGVYESAPTGLRCVTTPPGEIDVDGVLSEGEWDLADQYEGTITLPDGESTTLADIFITNDATNLYAAVRFHTDISEWGTNIGLRFDDDNNGAWDGGADGNGNDGFVAQDRVEPSADQFIDDFFSLDATPPQGQEDDAWQGTNDGEMAVGNDETGTVVEMSHPLLSDDPLRDFQLSSGNHVGFLVLINLPQDPAAQNRQFHVFPGQGGFWTYVVK